MIEIITRKELSVNGKQSKKFSEKLYYLFICKINIGIMQRTKFCYIYSGC